MTLDDSLRLQTERARILSVACKLAQQLGLGAILRHDPENEEGWRSIVTIILPGAAPIEWAVHDNDLPLFSHIPRILDHSRLAPVTLTERRCDEYTQKRDTKPMMAVRP